MADNVAITAGTGTTVGTDEVVDGVLGTVHVQFVKLMDGTLNGTNKLVIDADGAMKVIEKRAGTGTQSSVASTVTTNTTILAANTARIGATIYNESTAILFLLLGSAVESATVYSLQVPANGYFEVPFDYTGIIKGHWSAANGSARITEFSA